MSAAREFRRRQPRLIPIEPVLTTSPGRQQLQEIGELIVASQDAATNVLRNRPDVTAGLDQLAAAERDAQSLMLTVAAKDHRRVDLCDVATATTVRLSMAIAALRAVEARCPHVQWPPTPTSKPPLLVTVAAGAVTCSREGCARAALRRWHDNGRCDLCEREAAHFTACSGAIGPIVVSLHLCDPCVAFAQIGGER